MRGFAVGLTWPDRSWPSGQCQEHLTMTAEPPGSPVTEGVRSLEARWIFPGQLETAVAGSVLLVQSPGLEGVGEVDGLGAPARRRLGFGGGEEPRREAAPAQARRHPQALQFAAIAPGPPADADYDPASITHESPGRLRRQVPWRRTPHDGSAFPGLPCRPDPAGPRRGTPRRPAGQAPTICSISDRSSKYVRNDRIFPSRKSATVTPGNWTCRPVASSAVSSLSTSGPV